MSCWHCDRPAHATCLFCGRAVCREHVASLPHLLAVYQSKDPASPPKALVVPNAIHCGVCEPRDDPVTLEVLE